MIWFKRRLVGSVAPDLVNSRMLELKAAKKIMAELFNIRTCEVSEMIRQRMEERTLTVRSLAYE